MAEEKRTFSRIPTNLKAYVKMVTSAENLPTFSSGEASYEAAASMERLKKSNLPEVMVDFMLEINSKLDRLLSLFSQSSLAGDYPIKATVTEISGAGLKFHSDHAFKVGDAIEVVVVLSAFPVRMAAAVGKVVRKEADQGKEIWVLDYTRIRDNDLENMVQYVFQEQRARIREEKWSS